MVEIIVDNKKTRVAASSLASMYPYGIDENQKVITFDSGDKIITSSYFGEKIRQQAGGMVDVVIDGRPVCIDAYGVNMIVPVDEEHFAVYTDSGDKYLVSETDANRIAAAADKPLNNTTLYSIYECKDFGYDYNKILVGNKKMYEHLKEYGDAVIAITDKNNAGKIYRDYRLSTFQKETFQKEGTEETKQKDVARFVYSHGIRGLRYEDVITITWDDTDYNIIKSSRRGDNIVPVEDNLAIRNADGSLLLAPRKELNGGIVFQTVDIDERNKPTATGIHFIKGHYYRCEWGLVDKEIEEYDWVWEDITADIQRKYLPYPSKKWEGRIFEYIGETFIDELNPDNSRINGYFYQCIEDIPDNPGVYIWLQKDVQPNRIYTTFDVDNRKFGCNNKRAYKYLCKGGDVVIVPSAYTHDYALTEFQSDTYTALFSYENIVPGRYAVETWQITWSNPELSYLNLEEPRYVKSVIPVWGNAELIEPCEENSYGVIIQNENYSDNLTIDYYQGHFYRSESYNGSYIWKDITGTIQVPYLPAAIESNVGKIYEYIGEDAEESLTLPELTNGFFYQCVEKIDAPGSYEWVQKDVQPNGRLSSIFYVDDQEFRKKNININEKIFKHMYKGGDVVMTPDTYTHEYTLSTFQTNTYISIFEYENIVPGKYELESYILEWSNDGKLVNEVTFTSNVLPIFGDLTELSYEPCGDNCGGVVIQSRKYVGAEDNTYILGHSYRCDSYTYLDVTTYSWVDITGTVQVDKLPPAVKENYGKIFEYTGETIDTEAQPKFRINGYFYQCVKDDTTTTGFNWVQKDVQPNSISIIFDLDTLNITNYGNKRLFDRIHDGGDATMRVIGTDCSDTKEYRMSTFYNTAYAALFTNEEIFPGKHKFSSYIIDWDNFDTNYIESYSYEAHVIPILGNAYLIEPNEDNIDGVVLQSIDIEDEITEEKIFELGHLYKCTWNEKEYKYEWSDMTSTIQVAVLPKASEDYLGVIYEYTGPDKPKTASLPELVNGYFYQCVQDDDDPTVYRWIQKDVQPTRISTIFRPAAKKFDYTNRKMFKYLRRGGLASIKTDGSDGNRVSYFDVKSFDDTAYELVMSHDYIVPGRYSVDEYTVDWNKTDSSYNSIQSVVYNSYVIPYYDDLSQTELEADSENVGGIVIQSVDIDGVVNTSYIKGHYYESISYNGDYIWDDVTGTIQTKVLPENIEENNGKIYEYIGEHEDKNSEHDELVNGFFYQCRKNDDGNWYWFQKDVQPNRIKTKLIGSVLEYGNKRVYDGITGGADAIIIPDGKEYALVTLNDYKGFFERESLVRGKYEIFSYTLTWDKVDVKNPLEDVNFSYAVIPVWDDLSDIEVIASSYNLGGIVIQKEDYSDADVDYIKGHYYECVQDGADYEWVDVTGTIQVTKLPKEKEENEGKIYEYIGEFVEKDSTHDDLVNGYFYQCRKNDDGAWYWFQKDVQPARIKTNLNVTTKKLDYGNKRTYDYISYGGDAVIVVNDNEYALVSLNSYVGFFEKEYLVRGKHEMSSYTLTWDKNDVRNISDVNYAYAVIPVYDDLSNNLIKTDITTFGGIVIQTKDYSDVDVDYIKGHYYECSYDGADYEWVDVTGTIQVTKLPKEKEENEGKIYEYVGEFEAKTSTHDDLVNGYFYQCRKDDSGNWYWFQKDVQPARIKTNLNVTTKTLEYGNKRTYEYISYGGDAVIVVNDNEYALVSLNSHEGFFEKESLVRGKHEISSYTLTWDNTNFNNISDVNYAYAVIPVWDDLSDNLVAPCEDNFGGIVIQTKDYSDATVDYIKGHYYECSYDSSYKWVDVTGTIQVTKLPKEKEENEGKIYEYVGEFEAKTATHDDLVNGYFYQCRKNDDGNWYWFQKDVQPARIKTNFNVAAKTLEYGNKRTYDYISYGGDAVIVVNKNEYALVSLNSYVGFFEKEYLVRGKHEMSSYTLTWDNNNHNNISDVNYAYAVIPVYDNLSDGAIKTDETTYGGIVIQTEDYYDNGYLHYIKGHYYECSYDGSYKWIDVTGTIQVESLPKAKLENLGKIYEYIGDHKDAEGDMPELVNGYFYQCVEDPITTGKYIWVQKDVQPNGRLVGNFFYASKEFREKTLNVNQKIYKHMVKGGDVVMNIDTDIHEFTLSTFQTGSYVAIFEYENIVPGKYEISSYILDWDETSDGSVIDDVRYTTNIVPIFGDLTELAYAPCEENLGGVVTQSRKHNTDEENTYILGHYYRCEWDNAAYVYVWNDITGTIQVDKLPPAVKENYGKIFEYVGETIDTKAQPKYRINGYFYQCVVDKDSSTGYAWIQKDVQPVSLAVTFDLDYLKVTNLGSTGNKDLYNRIASGANATMKVIGVECDDTKEYRMKTFYNSAYAALFDNEVIYPGKHQFTSYIIDWNDADQSYVDSYRYSSHVVPVLDNAYLVKPDKDNLDGVILQMINVEDPVTEEVIFELGHLYKCTWNNKKSKYEWSDMTSTIQVAVLPKASEDYVGVIYEYVGADKPATASLPELVNGYFYQCVKDDEDPTKFRWVQKDVQPTRITTVFRTTAKTFEYSNKKMFKYLRRGGIAAIRTDGADNNPVSYYDVKSFDASAYELVLTNNYMIRGKHSADKYIIDWDKTDASYATISNVEFESYVIPYYDDLTDNLPATSYNLDGVVIQSVEIADYSYIIGHHYVCESYLGGYRWKDITGTIQIPTLPDADETSYLKIYEYTGVYKKADKTTYMPELVNGFFYQCVKDTKTGTGFNWVQKDVQPYRYVYHYDWYKKCFVDEDGDNINELVYNRVKNHHNIAVYINSGGGSDKELYELVTFNVDGDWAEFKYDFDVNGKSEFASYIVNWDLHKDTLAQTIYEYTVTPVYTDLNSTYINYKPTMVNEGGVVIQNSTYISEEIEFFKGHQYTSEMTTHIDPVTKQPVSEYRWVDITGTIQLEELPYASWRSYNDIYEYIGKDAPETAYFPELINGFFYQCIADKDDPTSYVWVQKDVQPNGRLYSKFFIKGGVTPELEVGNDVMLKHLQKGADAIISPDTDNRDYSLAQFGYESNAYVGRFDNASIIPGKYEIDSYTLTWTSSTNVSYESSYVVIPVLGNLIDTELVASSYNYGGVVIQSETTTDNVYIKGHYYRNELDTDGSFVWNDITGTIQVEVLPQANKDNSSVIYEYIGEYAPKDASHDELINGFFYQCRKNDAGDWYWFQKDVQPNKIRTDLDIINKNIEYGNKRTYEYISYGGDVTINIDSDGRDFNLDNMNGYVGRFSYEFRIPGKYEIDFCTITWDDTNLNNIDVEYAYNIIPVYGKVENIIASEENAYGIVIEDASYYNAYTNYIEGHVYRCESYNGIYDWNDITGTIQVDELPLANEKLEGVIYQYTGNDADATAYFPELTNGYFYQCMENVKTPGIYEWVRKDVQPNGRLILKYNTRTRQFVNEDGENINKTVYKELSECKDAVAYIGTSSTDTLTLSSFSKTQKSAVFTQLIQIPGLYKQTAYLVIWDRTDNDIISYGYSSNSTVPEYANLANSKYEAIKMNRGGIVIQTEDKITEDYEYLKGHQYVCEEYSYTSPLGYLETGFHWVDTTGTIQVTALPYATERSYDKIYEYVGENAARTEDFPELVNGFFYKCVVDADDPTSYSWVQKDVQPYRHIYHYDWYRQCFYNEYGENINDIVWDKISSNHNVCAYINIDGGSREDIFELVSFNHNRNFVEFKYDLDIYGKSFLTAYTITWSTDPMVLDETQYIKTISPIYDNLTNSYYEPTLKNIGGTVIQNTSYISKEIEFLKGHQYLSTMKSYIDPVTHKKVTVNAWDDITGTIQVEQLPYASWRSYNDIYEYIGKNQPATTYFPELVNGFFYQCVADKDDITSYHWEQKNVQPQGRICSYFITGDKEFQKDGENINKDIFKHLVAGGDIVMIPDAYTHDYVLSSFQTDSNVGLFEYVMNVPGKYQIESYTLTWNDIDSNVVDSAYYACDVLPVLGDLSLDEYEPCAYNENGVIIQTKDYYDDDSYICYLRGHYYRCESYTYEGVVSFSWNDITGTIQVEKLPEPCKKLEGKVYEYIGEDDDEKRLTNGFFYQCVEDDIIEGLYIWKAKDVQERFTVYSEFDCNTNTFAFGNKELYEHLIRCGEVTIDFINIPETLDAPGRYKSYRIELNETADVISFKDDIIVDGYHKVDIINIGWDKTDKNYINYVENSSQSHILPVSGSVVPGIGIAAIKANEGGIVIQDENWTDGDEEYILGHMYKNVNIGTELNPVYMWVDVTDSIQVSELPLPLSVYEGRIYQYIGEYKEEDNIYPERRTGYFYKCELNEAGIINTYHWVQQDVQPRKIKSLYRTGDRKFDYGNDRMYYVLMNNSYMSRNFDIVLTSDGIDAHPVADYDLAYFDANNRYARFERTVSVPGKYSKEEYDIIWSSTSYETIASSTFVPHVMPIDGNVNEIAPISVNEGGVVLQNCDVYDEIVTTKLKYIRGHVYRCQEKTPYEIPIEYEWVDITGSIQITDLPEPSAEFIGKIYEYIGETKQDPYEWGNIIVNGFFYQCTEVLAQYGWVEDKSGATGPDKEFMPNPCEEELDKVYRYVGEDSLQFKKNHYYRCIKISDKVYRWRQKNVQPVDGRKTVGFTIVSELSEHTCYGNFEGGNDVMYEYLVSGGNAQLNISVYQLDLIRFSAVDNVATWAQRTIKPGVEEVFSFQTYWDESHPENPVYCVYVYQNNLINGSVRDTEIITYLDNPSLENTGAVIYQSWDDVYKQKLDDPYYFTGHFYKIEYDLAHGVRYWKDCGATGQVSKMPTPDWMYEDNIFQYIGETTSYYTTNYFYRCKKGVTSYLWKEDATGIPVAYVNTMPDACPENYELSYLYTGSSYYGDGFINGYIYTCDTIDYSWVQVDVQPAALKTIARLVPQISETSYEIMGYQFKIGELSYYDSNLLIKDVLEHNGNNIQLFNEDGEFMYHYESKETISPTKKVYKFNSDYRYFTIDVDFDANSVTGFEIEYSYIYRHKIDGGTWD